MQPAHKIPPVPVEEAGMYTSKYSTVPVMCPQQPLGTVTMMYYSQEETGIQKHEVVQPRLPNSQISARASA